MENCMACVCVAPKQADSSHLGRAGSESREARPCCFLSVFHHLLLLVYFSTFLGQMG